MINPLDIPRGNSKNDIAKRNKIISEFYDEWIKNNPKQREYNIHLKQYIYVDKKHSKNETKFRASKFYLSTLCVLQLSNVLKNAEKYDIKTTKIGNKGQSDFQKIILMKYELVGIGVVKLTVGLTKKDARLIQYCVMEKIKRAALNRSL